MVSPPAIAARAKTTSMATGAGPAACSVHRLAGGRREANSFLADSAARSTRSSAAATGIVGVGLIAQGWRGVSRLEDNECHPGSHLCQH
jgi:hypothetical protein